MVFLEIGKRTCWSSILPIAFYRRKRVSCAAMDRFTVSRDANGLLIAVLVHGVVLLVLGYATPRRTADQVRFVELMVDTPAPAEPDVVRHPETPPPDSSQLKAGVLAGRRNRPIAPVAGPIGQPPAPRFGTTPESTVDDSSVEVVEGDTLAASPTRRRGGLGGPDDYGGAGGNALVDLSTVPSVIGASCGIPDERYPQEARRQGQQGITEVQIELDVEGKPQQMTVTHSAGSTLDSFALQWIQAHCRFRAGRNEQGAPVPSTFLQTYRWHIAARAKTAR